MFSLKREAENITQEEISHNIGNINVDDDFFEIVFKMYQHIKFYNDLLTELKARADEEVYDLDKMERQMVKEEDFKYLEEGVAVSLKQVSEIEVKIKNMNQDMMTLLEILIQYETKKNKD